MDHLSPEVNRPRREADHTIPPSVEAKSAWRNSSTLPYACMVFIWTISVSVLIRLRAVGKEIWFSIYGGGEIMVFMLTTSRLPVACLHNIPRR